MRRGWERAPTGATGDRTKGKSECVSAAVAWPCRGSGVKEFEYPLRVDVLEVIRSDRVVAVVRASSIRDPVGLASAFVESGVRCVEITFTVAGALDAIEAAAGHPEVIVGAGTVTSPTQATDAVAAGASFIVSPVLMPELVELVDVPVILAGFTPTEVHEATRAGAAAIKLFPARLGGPTYIRDLLAPMPEAQLMPSGGVDQRNADAYLDAGAIAVYSSSSLLPDGAAESGDHDVIRDRARKFVQALR